MIVPDGGERGARDEDSALLGWRQLPRAPPLAQQQRRHRRERARDAGSNVDGPDVRVLLHAAEPAPEALLGVAVFGTHR